MSAVIRHVAAVWSRCLFGQPWPTASGRARSDFLFVQPSAFHGVARLFDVGGTYDVYNMSSTIAYADSNALLADLMVVGGDLRDVIDMWDRAPEPQIPLPFSGATTALPRVEVTQ